MADLCLLNESFTYHAFNKRRSEGSLIGILFGDRIDTQQNLIARLFGGGHSYHWKCRIAWSIWRDQVGNYVHAQSPRHWASIAQCLDGERLMGSLPFPDQRLILDRSDYKDNAIDLDVFTGRSISYCAPLQFLFPRSRRSDRPQRLPLDICVAGNSRARPGPTPGQLPDSAICNSRAILARGTELKSRAKLAIRCTKRLLSIIDPTWVVRADSRNSHRNAAHSLVTSEHDPPIACAPHSH